MHRIIEIAKFAETEAFGRRLAALLFPGSVVALVGPLGAGKTHLVRAIAIGLGIANPNQVSSPTFVLIQEYEGRLPIYHFDAYRLKTEAEFADLGVHEYFQGQGVCLVEWADKVTGCLPAELLTIKIVVTGEETRRLEIEGRGEPYQRNREEHLVIVSHARVIRTRRSGARNDKSVQLWHRKIPGNRVVSACVLDFLDGTGRQKFIDGGVNPERTPGENSLGTAFLAPIANAAVASRRA